MLNTTPAYLQAVTTSFRFTRTDALLLTMAVIWGVNYSVVKRGAQLIPPLAFNAMRVGIAAVVLISLAALRGRPWPDGRDITRLLALGVIGNCLYQMLFISAITRTRAGSVAIVLASSPAWLALAGRIRGVEHISRRMVVGIVASIVGVSAVVLGGTATIADPVNPAPTLGNALALAGTLAWAVYTVLLAPFTHRVEPLQLVSLTMVGGAVPITLIALPQLVRTDWGAAGVEGWAALMYGSLLALVAALLMWYHGIRVLGPTRTAMYSNMQSIIALGAAAVALGEIPTLWQVAGAAAIMTGLLLTRR